MQITEKISSFIDRLPSEDQKFLRDLSENDPEFFDMTMKEIIQLYIVLKSGNKRGWTRMKERFDSQLNNTLSLMEEDMKIAEIEDKLSNTN